MSKEKKLSRDVLSRWLDNLRDFAIRMLGEHPSKEDESWSKSDNEAVEQLKSLIESSAQEPSEAEIEEFVGKWKAEFIAIFMGLSDYSWATVVQEILKEYRELLRRG